MIKLLLGSLETYTQRCFDNMEMKAKEIEAVVTELGMKGALPSLPLMLQKNYS